jgi:hypothetical protein
MGGMGVLGQDHAHQVQGEGLASHIVWHHQPWACQVVITSAVVAIPHK